MKLIVFLGNPGTKYENTRHNAGFLCADYFQKKHDFSLFSPEKKFFGSISSGHIHGEKIILLKPETFMNCSGKSLLSVVNFYKIPTKNVLLVFDDKDQLFGKVRFREKGSAGGHNGVRDCLRVLGTEEVARIKIGIDAPIRMEKNIDTADFVLSRFSADELSALKKTIFGEVEKKILEWILWKC